jgi:hypothetical protein
MTESYEFIQSCLAAGLAPTFEKKANLLVWALKMRNKGHYLVGIIQLIERHDSYGPGWATVIRKAIKTADEVLV